MAYFLYKGLNSAKKVEFYIIRGWSCTGALKAPSAVTAQRWNRTAFPERER